MDSIDTDGNGTINYTGNLIFFSEINNFRIFGGNNGEKYLYERRKIVYGI